MSTETITQPIWQERGEFNRVFIPSSMNEGCPVGCSYCYIANKGQRPIPFNTRQYGEMLESVVSDPRYVPGRTLLSLGCESDPLLEELLPSTGQVLEYFSKQNGFPKIQLASKLVISDAFTDIASIWPQNKISPVFSISIPTIKLSEQLERHAPSPNQRAINVEKIRGLGWTSIILIKPFMPTTAIEVDEFAKLLKRHLPDAIVVGEKYRQGVGAGSQTVHPINPKWSRQDQTEARSMFVRKLLEKGVPPLIFDSSVDAAINWLQR